MPGQTGLTQRRQKYQRNSELAKAGICIACESEPVTTNQDGSTSIRCAQCKAKQPPKNRVRKLNSANAVKPRKPVGEWGMDEDYGYLDTPRFAVYCTMLRSLITRSKAPMSIADMKRALGDSFSERMHMDALDSISDSVECFQAGAMSRYRPITARGEAGKGWNKQLRWNNNQRPVTGSKTYPFALMDDTRRRELA